MALMAAVGCGGSGSSSKAGGNPIATSAANVAPIVVDSGPSALAATSPAFNEAFVTVTVCDPTNTSNCNTIDHVLVDTGSYGLRLLSSTGGGELTVSLPQETDPGTSNTISECSEFVDNVSYGTVRMANITVASETATAVSGNSQAGVPIQVIGDLTSIPASCASIGLGLQDTLQTLGANGILGIGLEPFDCGTGCTQTVTGNPTIYYFCTSTGCSDAVLSSVSQEVFNPVVLFSTDNNGTIVQLPSVASGGANSVSGSLVFGIGTQSNNGLGSAKVLSLDQSDSFTTLYQGSAFEGFTDSGSNGLFYDDSTLALCSDNPFYCPSNTKTYSGSTVQNQGAAGENTRGVTFSVESADSLFGTAFNAYNDLAGPVSGTLSSQNWDWGLPFFFGRNVYQGIDGQTVSGQTTPFIAY
jgi:hypothetical protein